MTISKIVSFGRRHGVPTDGVVIDVRTLDNPFEKRELRPLNGLDPRVQANIRKSRSFDQVYEVWKRQARLAGGEILYIGCMGGHHRSVYIAELLGKELGVPVEHRDIAKR